MVVPEKGRNSVLQELHGRHLGMLLYGAWPGMDKDVEWLVSKCPQVSGYKTFTTIGSPTDLELDYQTCARIHINYAGPVQGQMLLLVIEVEVGKADLTIQ